MKSIVRFTSCLLAAVCGVMVALGDVLPNEWVVEPTLSKTVWMYQKDAPATIVPGEAKYGEIACDYTDAQLAALQPGYYRVTFSVAPTDTYEGLVKRVFVKVDRRQVSAAVYELSADKQTLVVTVDPADEARDLVLCSGDVDAGNVVDAWRDVRVLAEVPAGETEVRCSLPGFGSKYELARACLRYQTTVKNAALGYAAPEHLLAQWDGKDNAGYDVHDGSRTYPLELTGNIVSPTLTGTIPAGDTFFTFGSGDLKFKSAAIANAINAGSMTVELLLGGTGTLVNNGGIIGFGPNGPRGLWIYQKPSGMIGDVSYHGNTAYTVGVGTASETNSYVFNLGPTTMQSKLYVDGVERATITRQTTDMGTDNDCCLGVIGNYARASVRVYSIRIYDKQLSAEEMTQNRLLDNQRFGDGLEQIEMSQLLVATDSLVIKKIFTDDAKTPAALRVACPVTNAVNQLFVVWGRKDRGENLEDWGDSRAYLGEMPERTAAKEFELPATVRAQVDQYTGFRVMVKAKLSARTYAASDHLLAQWDGEENAGYGVHDSTRTYPLELTGSVVDPALSGTFGAGGNYFAYGSGMLTFHLPKLVAAINEGHATVELTMTSVGLNPQNGGLFYFGDKTRGIWLYQDGSHFIGSASYHSVRSGEAWEVQYSRNSGDFDTWTLSMGEDTAHSALYCSDGTSKGLVRFSTDLAADDDICRLGALWWKDGEIRSQARVHSIRVYDKRLTDEERAQNAQIDIQRFKNDRIFFASEVSPFKRGGQGLIVSIR